MKYHWKANSCSIKMNIHKSKFMLYCYSSSFQKITLTCKFCKMLNFFLESSFYEAVRDGPFDIQGGGWDFFEKIVCFP